MAAAPATSWLWERRRNEERRHRRCRLASTSQAVTAEAARPVAELAVAHRERGLDPRDVARFLDRVVFSLFAEDVGLLPEPENVPGGTPCPE